MCLPKVLKPMPIKMDVPAKRVLRQSRSPSFFHLPVGHETNAASLLKNAFVSSHAAPRSLVRTYVRIAFAVSRVENLARRIRSRVHVHFSFAKQRRVPFASVSDVFERAGSTNTWRCRRSLSQFSRETIKSNAARWSSVTASRTGRLKRSRQITLTRRGKTTASVRA